MAAPGASASPADWRGDVVPYAVAALTGLVVCLAIAGATGKREAWDAGVYFSVGIPLMCVVVFAIAYRFPTHPWRWTVAMAAGQAASMPLAGSDLSLWPLAIVATAVLSIPQYIAGFAGAFLGRRRRAG